MKKFKIEMTVVADDYVTVEDVIRKFKFYGTNSTTRFDSNLCGIFVTQLINKPVASEADYDHYINDCKEDIKNGKTDKEIIQNFKEADSTWKEEELLPIIKRAREIYNA